MSPIKISVKLTSSATIAKLKERHRSGLNLPLKTLT